MAAILYGPLAVVLLFSLLTLRAVLVHLRPRLSFAPAVRAGKGLLLTASASRGLRG